MNKALVASLEAIDFQRDSTFLAEMAKVFDGCIKDPSKESFNSASISLQKIAKKHSGMLFNFHFCRMGGANAFVIPPQADIAAPMRPDELATKVKSYGRPVSEQELFKGTVDIKTGKVSGIYSEIPVDVFIATEFFTGSASSSFEGIHVAAVSLHEIGHAFTYLRYLGNMVLSNVVVSEITRRQHEGADDKVIQEVIKIAEQKTGWRMRDVGEINRSTDPILVQQIVMKGMVDSIRSELKTKFYDKRAFEFSADQFVARHGGASYIVQALDIMYKEYPQYFREYRGRVSNIYASLVGYTTLFAGALFISLGSVAIAKMGFLAATALAYAPLWVFMGGVFVLTSLFGEVDEGIYDPIPKRYEAMRRELISSSKDQNLSIKQRQEIIDQVKMIDDILDEVTKNSKGFFGPQVIGEFLVGVFTGRAGEQKFQRMLENLANNRLFELSNQLQTKMV